MRCWYVNWPRTVLEWLELNAFLPFGDKTSKFSFRRERRMENSGREVEETVKNNQEVEAEVTKACSCSTFFASGGKIFYKS